MNDTILLAMPEKELTQVLAEAFDNCRHGRILALATSRLAQSSLVEPFFLPGDLIASSGRGKGMQSLLSWAVEELRPNGQNNGEGLKFQRYNVLKGFYIEGKPIAELLAEMNIGKQTFYRRRQEAFEDVAKVLCEALPKMQAKSPQMLNSIINRRQGFAIDQRYQSHNDLEKRLLRLLSIFRYPVSIEQLHHILRHSYNEQIAIQGSLHHWLKDGGGLLMSDDEVTELLARPQIRQRLLTRLSSEERQRWHEAAGWYHEQQGEYLEAAYHFRLLSGYQKRAAELLIQHYQDIVDDLQLEELRQLLSKFRSAELPDSLWRKVKLVAGQAAEMMADLDSALEEYSKALGAKDIRIKAEAHYWHGKVFQFKNVDESLAHYTRGIELLEQAISHEPLLIKMYIDRAWLFIQERWLPEQAAVSLEHAERLMPPQNQAEWVVLHNAWAALLQRQGESKKALQRRWQAWLLAQEVQDVNLMIKTAHNLGIHYYRMGQFEQGLTYLRKSKALAIKAGNRKIEGACDAHIGACYFKRGEYKEAIPYYRMSYDLFTASDNYNWQAHACYNLAEVYAKIGDNAHTEQYFDEGVALADASGDQDLLKLFDKLANISRALVPPTISLNKQKGQRERQRQAFDYIKQHGQITNSQYQKLHRVSASTAYRDLKELVKKRLLVEKGSTRDRCYKLPTR